jgi:hypothetical protein
MVTETRDRRINTDEKMRNDGAKRLPHERDETPDGQDVHSRGIMRQAADDVEQGLVDTDLHGQRGLEQAIEPTGSGQANPHDDAANGMRDRPARTSRTTRE